MGPGISYRDWAKRASASGQLDLSITTGTEVLPIENAQTKRLREITRITTAGSSSAIRLDFNGGVLTDNDWTGENGITVGAVGLFNLTFGLGGSIRVKVYTDDDNVTPALNKSVNLLVPSNYNLEHGYTNYFLPLDQIYSDVQRVDIEISSTPGTVDIGRVWVGNYIETIFSRGWGHGPDLISRLNFSRGRDAHSVFARRTRRASFAFEMIPYETAYGVHTGVTINNTGTFNDMYQTAGNDSEIVVHPRVTDFIEVDHPTLPTTSYGLLTKVNKITEQGGNYFKTDFEMRELI